MVRTLLVIAVLGLFSCEPTAPRCDSTTCFGCCDATGQCQGGGATDACGAQGNRCDVCVGSQTCALGRCQAPSCLPANCAALGFDCGQAEDGCGGVLECGSCGVGRTCGGGGRRNVCAPGVCTPASCAALNAECGRVSDGCAALLTCGSCSAGSSCGLNAPNRCACRPTTCSTLGRECGEVSDGCSAMLSCGSCSGGRTCGGGGAPGICGTGSCTPKTCAELSKECGSVSDGCGGMLACGSCSGALSCGGGGTPNVCGATCGNGCPSGFSCDPRGVCTGSSSSLVLNVLAVPVSGTVRLNGAAPVRGSSCSSSTSSSGYVTFIDAVTGTQLRADTSCSSANFAFNLTVPPGTYKVSVYNFGPTYSNLPEGLSAVNPALVVSGAVSALDLNVLAVPVSGAVRLNGATPVRGSSCSSSTSSSGYVIFANEVTQLRADTSCSSANFAFNLTVPPGTYKVSVYNFGPAYSNLPDGLSAVNPALVVSGAVSALDLNVLAVPVSGTVRLNGAAPVRGSSCSSSTASSGYVTFANEVTGTQLRADTSCSSANFAFNLSVPPGTYKVSVYNFGPAYSNLPDGLSAVNPALVVSGAVSALDLNVLAVPVSGTVRLNGATPVRGSSCSSSTSSSGYVTFANEVTGTQLRADTSCSSANFAFNLTVPPGTYKVSVYNFGPTYSNLPEGLSGVNPALVVSGAVSALDLNVLAVPVSGTVRLNGAAPVRGSSCSSSTSSSGYVTFANEVTGTQLRADTSCSSANFAFNLTVPPGTYKVSVYNFGPAYSNLPEGLSGVVNQLRLQ